MSAIAVLRRADAGDLFTDETGDPNVHSWTRSSLVVPIALWELGLLELGQQMRNTKQRWPTRVRPWLLTDTGRLVLERGARG